MHMPATALICRHRGDDPPRAQSRFSSLLVTMGAGRAPPRVRREKLQMGTVEAAATRA
jgi:hypothetical protein